MELASAAGSLDSMKRFILAVALVAVLGVIAFIAAFIFSGGPLAHEMACSQGEAPANDADGGSACFKEGSELPSGYTWDPRGNYPLH